jgi:nucleoside-diphosphate-sugar epimerase
MKIAVLGATGFLGSNLVVHFRGQGHAVHAWGRSLAVNDSQNFRWDADKLNNVDARWLQYDVVIYAAGAGVQSQPPADFDQLMSVNFSYPAHLMHFLSTEGFRGFFISFGSYFEIGNNTNPQPFTEEQVAYSGNIVPNVYSASKRLLTRWILSSEWAMPQTHLILPTIYGEGEAPHRLIPYLYECASTGTLPKLSAGRQVRQYVHVHDVCRAVEKLLVHPQGSTLLNMPGKEILSVQALATQVYDALGVALPTHAFGQITARDTSMGYLALDGSLYERLQLPLPSIAIQQHVQQLVSHHV